MLFYLINSWSFFWIIREYWQNKIFEVFTKVLAINFLPVLLYLPCAYQVVEVLFRACFLEREYALDNNEKDDAKRKQINLSALVDLTFFDLGCHVSHGSAVAVKAIYVFVAGKSKISKFDIQILIDQDILKLQVTVHDSATVHVLDTLKQLVSEKSACVFAHGSHKLTHVEK